MNVDFEGIHRWLRMEYGPGNQPEPEISRVLADVDKDLEDCSSELRYLQSHVSFLQNQRRRLEEYKTCLGSPIRRLPTNET